MPSRLSVSQNAVKRFFVDRPHSPVQPSELRVALQSSWDGFRSYDGREYKLGLAVSGGVDSMALALLFSKLQATGFNLTINTFIVDHRAREGSTEEAERTRQRLHQLGLNAIILPLQWPMGVSPLDLPDFETQARRLRYQALGNACKLRGTRWLITAHHRDDQAESVLMNLVRSRSGTNLLGIKAEGWIPECWGMHGVHQSGQHEVAERRLDGLTEKSGELTRRRQKLKAGTRRILDSSTYIEAGGVHVIRPLINFNKRDLVATCEAEGVSWEEDKTNMDIRRTLRNVARFLLQGEKLPLALRRQPLLNMLDRCHFRKLQLNRSVHAVERACGIVSLDIRSGVLKVRMAKSVLPQPWKSDPLSRSLKDKIAASALESLISSVSSLETVSLQGLKSAAEAIFADFGAQPPRDGNDNVTLTAGGVVFQRHIYPMPETLSPAPENREGEPDWALDPKYVWSLSRQPFGKAQPYLHIPGCDPVPGHSHRPDSAFGPWQLWDGRYWIRVKNLTTSKLLIRPLKPDDMAMIKTCQSKGTWERLRETLKQCAPGKIRWTLPAIVQVPDDGMTSGKILALPSLGETGIVDVVTPSGTTRLDWDIRYKMIFLKSRHTSKSDDRWSNIKHRRDLIRTWNN